MSSCLLLWLQLKALVGHVVLSRIYRNSFFGRSFLLAAGFHWPGKKTKKVRSKLRKTRKWKKERIKAIIYPTRKKTVLANKAIKTLFNTKADRFNGRKYWYRVKE